MTARKDKVEELMRQYRNEIKEIEAQYQAALDEAQAIFDKEYEDAQNKYFATVTPIRNEIRRIKDPMLDKLWKSIDAVRDGVCDNCGH
jgi:ElaB/YqjD/DUF883 family membrane-anchored ribosome-binding protein